MNGPRAVTFYRGLLWLYPPAFRDEYGVDMALLFAEQLRDEGAARVWTRGLIDLAVTVPTQYVEVHMNRSWNPIVPLTFAAISLSGLFVALVIGSNFATSGIGIGVAVVAGLLAMYSWRQMRGVAGVETTTSHWWQVLLAGGGILTTEVIVLTIVGELPEGWWAPAMIALLAGIVTTGTGLVLGIARLVSRRDHAEPTPS